MREAGVGEQKALGMRQGEGETRNEAVTGGRRQNAGCRRREARSCVRQGRRTMG